MGQLIEALKATPQHSRVVTQGYEGGYCDIDLKKIAEIKIKLNVHPNTEWWMGEHDDIDSTEENLPIEDALLLSCSEAR